MAKALASMPNMRGAKPPTETRSRTASLRRSRIPRQGRSKGEVGPLMWLISILAQRDIARGWIARRNFLALSG
jgi:hypothetical protein